MRLAFDDAANTAMASLAPTADIFVFSFVLHENAAGLLDNNGASDWSDSSTLRKEETHVEDGGGDRLQQHSYEKSPQQSAGAVVPPKIGGCLTGM